MNHCFFLYGTLCDPDLFRIVSRVPFAGRPATLPGASVRWVAGENFPILIEDAGQTQGVVVEVDDNVRARLDFYELGFGYGVEAREVATAGGRVTATVYVPDPDRWPVGAPWSLAHWQAEHGELSRAAAEEYMRLFGVLDAEAAARTFDQVRMRAAARLRAKLEPSPGIGPSVAAEVMPELTAQPYTDYFAVREDWLSFPRFDGGKSPVVKRATFMGGDAVTVLPYDPSTDMVLVVRQFRHGAFCRGDPNPWTLEPAAGRIDAGETPDETARRELLEETGVSASALHFVGRYYPSPGAYSEYIYSYVAIADLADRDLGVGGLLGEDEDIMAHVLPLDAAMGMIPDGTMNTGPLILSLGWLALNRDRLQRG